MQHILCFHVRQFHNFQPPLANLLPDQGQGGGQAIEDGAALGALFTHLNSSDDISERVQLFEDVRKNRASAMQMFSNVGQDEAEKMEKDAQPFVRGPVPSTYMLLDYSVK